MPTELPEEFRSRIGRDLPLYAEKLIYSLENTDPSVSARVNPLKLRDGEEISSVMPGAADIVPWCAAGPRVLILRMIPLFIRGAIMCRTLPRWRLTAS